MHFQLAPRPGQPPQRTLVLELMGRHSNVLLLDERQRITAIARQVRSHQSRIRPIGTGDAYSPPPALQGTAPRLDEPAQRWRERLELLPLSLEKAMRSAYQGISPVLARHLADEHDDAARARLASSTFSSRGLFFGKSMTTSSRFFSAKSRNAFCVSTWSCRAIQGGHQSLPVKSTNTSLLFLAA